MQAHRHALHRYGDSRFPEVLQMCGTWATVRQQLTGEGCPGLGSRHSAFLCCTLLAQFLGEGPT